MWKTMFPYVSVFHCCGRSQSDIIEDARQLTRQRLSCLPRYRTNLRRGGRVAEGGGLLNRYRVKSSIGGSNPPLSARLISNFRKSPERTAHVDHLFSLVQESFPGSAFKTPRAQEICN